MSDHLAAFEAACKLPCKHCGLPIGQHRMLSLDDKRNTCVLALQEALAESERISEGRRQRLWALEQEHNEARRRWIDTNVPCGQLPEGWQMDIGLELGAGYVSLYDRHGYPVPFDDTDLTVKEQVEAAVAVARAKEGV